MTPGDVARLLGTCALYDYRETSRHDAVAWYAVIGDLDFEEASEAVRRHYRDSTDRIMPAHLRRIVRQIRDEHRASAPARALPSPFEHDPELEQRSGRGAESARQALGPVLELLAAKQAGVPSAMDELRALTAVPDSPDDGVVHEGEVIR